MSTYHDIIDYRTTGSYAHGKLRHPDYNEDHMLVIANIVDIVEKRSNYFNLIPHWLEDDIVQEIKDENISLNSIPRIRVACGIYDIWLRNTSNLESVSIEIDGLGVVYSHTLTNDELNKDCFQIPLAFYTNGERVKKYIFDAYKAPFRISWIPTVGLYQKDIRIILNNGATATVYLSTVYFPKMHRRYLYYLNDTEFYINGKSIIHSYDKSFAYQQRQSCWEWLFSSKQKDKNI